MLHPYFAIVGIIISVTGSAAYLIETIKGRAQPNKVSFLLWSLAPLVAFFAQISQDFGLESLMTLSVGISPLIIFFASFLNKKSNWKITKFDVFCGLLSLLGFVLWRLTSDYKLAIILSIIADAFAAFPTLKKSYFHPESEVAWPWLMTSLGIVLVVLTLKEITIANSAFNIYIFLVNTIIFGFIRFSPNNKK